MDPPVWNKAMSDNDVEDVSFLSGEGQTAKKTKYEPRPSERFKQIICGQGRAYLIAVTAAVVIISVALIASFARPSSPCGENVSHLMSTDSDSSYSSHPTETASSPPTGKAAFPYKNIRLPKSIIPLSYRLFMHPNITHLNFSGQVVISATVKEETNFIILHAKNMNITECKVSSVDGTSSHEIQINKIESTEKLEQYYLGMGRSLRSGETIKIEMKFAAKLSSSMAGFYKSSYTTKEGDIVYLATTHFEPTDARAAFPCFDEPALKANFTIIIVREKRHISLSNMPLARTEERVDGLLVDHFETSVRMSTYLVAFVVSDFKHISNRTSKNVKVSVYAPPDLINYTGFALEAATTILEAYEHFFGIGYPLPKLDLIAIPDFAAGAMENWGLITYRMTSILYNPEQASAGDQQWVAIVIAHELAHQWFGNLVTMKWWNDLWLNEGFAAFVEFIGAGILKPEWKMDEQFVTDTHEVALNLDSLSNSHPISVAVRNPAQINEIFDFISYDKGASIIRMAQGFLTPAVLKNGLYDYLNKYKYSNAVYKDLWDMLSKATGNEVDVSEVMDTWTLQMGYPVVSLKKDVADTWNITATQKRFLLNPTSDSSNGAKSPYNYTWHIPLTFQSHGEELTTDQIWMHRGPVQFQLPESTKWFKANVNQTGFYRVNYEEENWNAIIAQLQQNHEVLTPSDRAGLLDDAFAFARAGLLDSTKPLDMTLYLVKEEDLVPLKAALANLKFFPRVLVQTDGFEPFKKYIIKSLKPNVDSLGWEDEGSHLQKMLRSMVLPNVVMFGDKESYEKAREIFLDMKINGTRVSPNLKSAVYRAGVQYGTRSDWDYCWKMYMNALEPSEKVKFLHALSTSTDKTLLKKFLAMSLQQDKIRRQDMTTVLITVSYNPDGTRLAWDFLKANWDTIIKDFGGTDIARLVKRIPSQFATQEEKEEVETFFSKQKFSEAERSAKQALESIEANIKWKKKFQKKVIEWFQEHTSSS